MSEEWFASWFNSPYYNLLYRHRNFAEAEGFILRLLKHLQPSPSSTFLDLACGAGRHSYFIHQQGYMVTGVDLSSERIEEAREMAEEGLEFDVHDMREPFPGRWDFILNLFTSFGYFDDFEENMTVLGNVNEALQPGGTMVLDFLNVPVVMDGLVPAEKQSIGEIDIEIRRSIQKGMIVKDIRVRDGDQVFDFQERVRALTRNDFENLFERAGLKIVEIWGDYEGNPWIEHESPRLIFFCCCAQDPRVQSN
jgi:SAM-dependent methyltransferase